MLGIVRMRTGSDAIKSRCSAVLIHFAQKHDEFISSGACNNVISTERHAKNRGGAFDQPVSRFVPQVVVDTFQAIQVSHDNADRKLSPPDCQLQFGVEKRPVVETGQCVMSALVFLPASNLACAR